MYFNLELLSKYKKELMGVYAIGIILCHAHATICDMPSIVEKILSLGTICTEMFMLLSGIGIFYSLRKNKGKIIQWYKKRFLRLFVPYLILTIPYYVWFGYINNHSVCTILLNISTINYWINGSGAWFVAMITLCYLLAPLVYNIYVYCNNNPFIFIILFLIVFALSFFLGFYENATYSSSLFLLGMFISPYVQEQKRINWLYISIIGILLYVICSKISMLAFMPRIFFLFPLSIIIPIFFIDKIYYVKTFLFMGKISFESYLTNVYLGVVLKQYGHLIIPEKYQTGNYIQYLLVVILGIAISYLTNKLSNIISNSCTNTSSNA